MADGVPAMPIQRAARLKAMHKRARCKSAIRIKTLNRLESFSIRSDAENILIV